MFSKIARASAAIAASLLLAYIFVPADAGAIEVPPRPNDIPIVDQTSTLTDAQKKSLAERIAAERMKSGNQIAIVIVPTLGDETIEQYSLSIAREWGVGTKDNNNGVVLLVALNDKKVRIEVGTGLEGALTDVQSGRIIREVITPSFREGNYYEGIQGGLDTIIAAINGEYTETNPTVDTSGFPWEFIFFGALFGFSWLGSILARTRSWWAGGVIGGVAGGITGFLSGSLLFGAIGVGVLVTIGLLFDKFVSENYNSHARKGEKPSWWAGGGMIGGGGSNGGFGGFGGGSFGGGGSSGSW